MFPSPQEQALLKSMRKQLNSGVTPHQFGLEKLRFDELRYQAESLENSKTQADPHGQTLRSRRFLRGAVSVLMERVWEFLRLTAPAG